MNCISACLRPDVVSRSALFSLLLAAPVLVGCPHKTQWPQAKNLTAEIARKRLLKDGEQRERVSGQIKARMDGLKGLLAQADLDVILEVPTRVHISVRSFFEQPLVIFATDGVSATLMDGSQPGGPAFYKGPVTSGVLASFLRAPLWPNEVVGLFLGIAPVAGAKAEQMVIDDEAGTYSLALRPRRGNVSVVTARLLDDALQKIEVYEASGSLRYRMTYSDFRPVGGIGFAHAWRFEATTASGDIEAIKFSAVDVTVNGERFDDRAFAVQLPPGVEWRKISDLNLTVDTAPAEDAPRQPPATESGETAEGGES